MGDIVYDNNGTYWTYLGRLDGKTHRASTKTSARGATAADRLAAKKTAEAIALTLRSQFRLRRLGLLPPLPTPTAACPTLAAYAPVWEAQHGKWQRGYAGRVAPRVALLVRQFGALPLSGLTPERVHTWRVARLEAGLKPRTINRDVDTLKGILSTAVPQYLAVSPLRGMPSLRTAPAIVPTLSHEDEAKILAALDDEDRAIFLVALDSLVRLGDVLALKWADLNLEDTTARINESKHGRTYYVPLSARTTAALLPMRWERVVRAADDDYVFPNAGGEAPRHVHSYTQRLGRTCARVGVPWGRATTGLTFHAATRHTGATRLAAAGVNLRTIQELGGWSDLSMLQRYVHPAPAHLRAAVEKIRIVE